MFAMNKFGFLAISLGCLAISATALAKTITVKPGQSIRSAVAIAKPADVIRVKPGIYQEGSPGRY